jgi:hypothetical protein
MTGSDLWASRMPVPLQRNGRSRACCLRGDASSWGTSLQTRTLAQCLPRSGINARAMDRFAPKVRHRRALDQRVVEDRSRAARAKHPICCRIGVLDCRTLYHRLRYPSERSNRV